MWGVFLVLIMNSCLRCWIDILSLCVSFGWLSGWLICCFIRRIVWWIFGCVVGVRFGGWGCGVLFFCVLFMSRMWRVFCIIVVLMWCNRIVVVMLIEVCLFEYVMWCLLIINSWFVIILCLLVFGKCLMKF